MDEKFAPLETVETEFDSGFDTLVVAETRKEIGKLLRQQQQSGTGIISEDEYLSVMYNFPA